MKVNDMKKVGIVSCYFKHNYGSMLQAYATQMILDKLEIDNETIDISGFNHEIKKRKIKYFIKASFTTDILRSKVGMAKTVIRKKIMRDEYQVNAKIRSDKFEKFSKRHFRMSSQSNTLMELSEKCEKEYSSVLVGSDQLWLPGNIAADYYTLNFVPDSVNTIAYATSFGMSTLPKDSAEKARVFLNQINYIGVREETGKKLVENLVNRDVPVVCDPTLLFTGEEWMAIQDEKPFISGNYILCYFLGNNREHREFAKKLRKKTGYEIVALLHLDEYIKADVNYADETPYNVGPSEFLNLIRNAKYVCTDSFHCSVFSILYEREFFTFQRFRKDTIQSTNSRIDTLFELTGIKNRLIKGDEDIEECMNIVSDYENINKKIERIRAQSLIYLKNAISMSED